MNAQTCSKLTWNSESIFNPFLILFDGIEGMLAAAVVFVLDIMSPYI